MSLVGPRPERPGFADAFSSDVAGYSQRYVVPPGVTGLAQVHGDYHSSPETKVRYDLAYISNWSLWLDCTILLRTVKVDPHLAERVNRAASTAATTAALRLAALVAPLTPLVLIAGAFVLCAGRGSRNPSFATSDATCGSSVTASAARATASSWRPASASARARLR